MKFLYIDTETGGLMPTLHALLSIGVVLGELTELGDPQDQRWARIGDEQGLMTLPQNGLLVHSVFSRSILPARGTSVSLEALQVQGLEWWHLENTTYEERIGEGEALVQLGEWLSHHEAQGLPIFAHSADFDRGFLSTAIARSALKHDFLGELSGRNARWNCTRYLAETLVTFGRMPLPQGGTLPGGKPVEPGVSLDALCLHLGLPLRVGAHEALEDAQLGAAVLNHLARIGGWV